MKKINIDENVTKKAMAVAGSKRKAAALFLTNRFL